MDERFVRLFRRQLAEGFADLRGAAASITLPISERLLNNLIAESVPHSAPVRDLHVRPQAGDRFEVRARIGSSSLLPQLKLTAAIDRQPEFPQSPVLILRLEATGLMSLAGPVLRLMDALPTGIRVEHDRIHVDIRSLLEHHQLGAHFDYIDELRVNTVEGAVVVSLRARVR